MPAKINDGLTRTQRYLNKGDNKEKRNAHLKAWRQTDRGKFIRNKNHWIASGIREPAESWETYWEEFKIKTHCDICNIEFDLENGATSKMARCLDHHHHSGYIRNIICRNCNISAMRHFDNKHNMVLFELQRYFRTSLDLIKIESNK